MNSDNVIRNKEEGVRFIESIREKAEKEGGEIRQGTEREIARLKELAAQEIQEFTRISQEEMKRHLKTELEKVNNRSDINKKKARLSIIEEITEELTRRAFLSLRSGDQSRYKEMLRNCLSEIQEQVHDSSEILCGSEDADLIREIQQSMPVGQDMKNIQVNVDPGITGGFLVNDPENGKSINCTFQRILYRSMDTVRRRVFSILSDHITIE